MTAMLSGWSNRWPNGVRCKQGEVSPDMEQYLMPPTCDSKFSKGNTPRCPNRKQPVSAEVAARYIEPQGPGTKKGWRWQRGWDGLYCAAINDQGVKDNFINTNQMSFALRFTQKRSGNFNSSIDIAVQFFHILGGNPVLAVA